MERNFGVLMLACVSILGATSCLQRTAVGINGVSGGSVDSRAKYAADLVGSEVVTTTEGERIPDSDVRTASDHPRTCIEDGKGGGYEYFYESPGSWRATEGLMVDGLPVMRSMDPPQTVDAFGRELLKLVPESERKYYGWVMVWGSVPAGLDVARYIKESVDQNKRPEIILPVDDVCYVENDRTDAFLSFASQRAGVTVTRDHLGIKSVDDSGVSVVPDSKQVVLGADARSVSIEPLVNILFRIYSPGYGTSDSRVDLLLGKPGDKAWGMYKLAFKSASGGGGHIDKCLRKFKRTCDPSVAQ